MIIGETTCVEVIKYVMESCYEEVKNDSDPLFERFVPRLKNRKYIIGVVGIEVIGLIVYCYNDDKTLIHIMVRQKFRARYAGLFAKKALKERKGTIYTEIPDLYPKVIKFAEKLGFEIIDRSKTVIKNGIEYAVNTLRLD